MDSYSTWIKQLFDRKEANGDWRWDFDSCPSTLTVAEDVEFFIRLMDGLPTYTHQYNCRQLSWGLEYLFNNTMSNIVFSIRDGDYPIDRRIEAIHKVKQLYDHVFEPLCEPTLGYLSEGGNELNGFCYMLWDASPLGYSEKTTPQQQTLAVIDVMRHALQSSNIACVESGLHGLGHLVMYHPKCSDIIESYIKSGKCSDERLLTYAKAAKMARVQ